MAEKKFMLSQLGRKLGARDRLPVRGHDLQYGITDNFSFGMGTSLGAFPFYITPKYSFRINEKNHLAVGDLLMIGTYGIDFAANLFYGTYTYGSEFSNATLGLGYLSSGPNDLFDNKVGSPVINLSLMGHLSPYMYFITENYITRFEVGRSAFYHSPDWTLQFSEDYTTNDYFLFGFSGFRFISKKVDVRSFTVGLAYYNQAVGSVPDKYSGSGWDSDLPNLNRLFIPTVSFTYKFGRAF